MPIYVVSYDLNRPGQNYPELTDALEGLSSQRILFSQWAVNARGPAQALAEYLWPHMDATDRLLVMARDSGDWYGIGLMARMDYM